MKEEVSCGARNETPAATIVTTSYLRASKTSPDTKSIKSMMHA